MSIVTVSRQYGSGGSEVAALVAGSLGWTLLDNALVDEVAARMRMTPQAVEAIEERVPSLAERLADTFALGAPELAPVYPAEAVPSMERRLLNVTRRVIDDAVARGNVVIVGRGAQSSLAQRSDALHVFCCAPREVLVARAAKRLGVTEAEAARTVDDTNRQREQYVRRHWNRSWAAPEHYHVCVNTGALGVEGAARLVTALARERFGG